MLLAILIAEHEYECNGQSLWITSAVDGVHSAKSLHYQGLAVDLRVKSLEQEARARVASSIRGALGDCYDVIHEHPGKDNEHIHIELSPLGLKRRGE